MNHNVLQGRNKWKKDIQETLRETFKANKYVEEVMNETLHIKKDVANGKQELDNNVGAALRSRMGVVAGSQTGGGGRGRGARYRHLYQQEEFSITTDIQDMLGSHHRLDMGSSWREQGSLGEKINTAKKESKEMTDVLEDNNKSGTAHIQNCSQQEVEKISSMKKMKEGRSKKHEVFKKMNHVKEKMDEQAGKMVLKSKTEVFICPICGTVFNQLICFADHNKKKHGDRKILEDFSYSTFRTIKVV